MCYHHSFGIFTNKTAVFGKGMDVRHKAMGFQLLEFCRFNSYPQLYHPNTHCNPHHFVSNTHSFPKTPVLLEKSPLVQL